MDRSASKYAIWGELFLPSGQPNNCSFNKVYNHLLREAYYILRENNHIEINCNFFFSFLTKEWCFVSINWAHILYFKKQFDLTSYAFISQSGMLTFAAPSFVFAWCKSPWNISTFMALFLILHCCLVIDMWLTYSKKVSITTRRLFTALSDVCMM